MKIKYLRQAIQNCDDDDVLCLMIKAKQGQYIPIKDQLTIQVQEKKMQPVKLQSQVLTEKDAAKYIGMSVSYLRRYRMEGMIGNRTPAPKWLKIGRSVRYQISDLDDWLSKR